MTRTVRRIVEVFVAAVLVIVAGAAGAGAAPKIIEPAQSPFTVQPAAGGKLAPFTIRVSGFRPGQQVFIEQCDGLATSAPHWTPDVDCDIGTAPAPVFTPASGIVVFDKSDVNHRFTPVAGLSPEKLFACFTSSSPKGIPHFDTCKVRISTNNTQATSDQIFLDLDRGGRSGSSTTKSSSSGSSSAPVLIVVGVVVVVLLGGAVALRGRRRRATGT